MLPCNYLINGFHPFQMVVHQIQIFLLPMFKLNNGSRMTTYKTPPELAGKDYETWKKEVSLWQSITDLPAEKQAVAITLSLSGQYREVATSINSNC